MIKTTETSESMSYYKKDNDVYSFANYEMITTDQNLFLNDGFSYLNLDYSP